MKLKTALFSILLLTGCVLFDNKKTVVEKPVAIEQIPSIFETEEIYMTKAYETAATRAANKMLDDTADIYESWNRPRLYIKQTIKESPNLPDGFYTARKALKQITGGAGAYLVVDNIDDANYILDSRVNEMMIGNLPAIVFKLSLNDAYDQPIRAWNVVIKQMAEDKSWW
ncbi:MAG: hypothetical protein IJ545_07410 [Alphaproteobacteria bacterium]|nr:hypothetical protein [Alphaproteobacteria bacterium]